MHLGAEATVLERLFRYDIFAISQSQIFKTESVARWLFNLLSSKEIYYYCAMNLGMLRNPESINLFCEFFKELIFFFLKFN